MIKRLAKLLIQLIIILIGIVAIIYFISDLTNTKTQTNLQPNQLDQNNNQTTTPQDTNSNYHVYFCPEDDCNTILYNTLNNAKTIDCAVYDITLNWIYDLVKTKNIRIVTDNDQLTNYGKQFDFVKTDNSKDYMHNKFCILDSNLLLIGSLNFTQDAIENQNNNFIITNNKYFISEAQIDFNNLWNGNFTKAFDADSICFSPGNCMDHYVKAAQTAKESIKCMFFSFTYGDLEKELKNAKNKGLDVKLIMEKSQDSQYSEYNKLKNADIKVIWDQNPSYMHNKFCVFDSNIVITGSMNPSNNGNFNNNESIIIINNSTIAKQYENYFNKYYAMWS